MILKVEFSLAPGYFVGSGYILIILGSGNDTVSKTGRQKIPVEIFNIMRDIAMDKIKVYDIVR